ncbi:MAG: hypothetical protein C0631_04425 [Sedimenticola sp.]|nr:MAG: hypothetical protein C0631_04425 [Sedimenticola sp.]
MNRDDADTIKQREITFMEFHPDPNQAQTAADILSEVPGILEAWSESPTLLKIRYNLMDISLQQIEEGLIDSGFHLSGRIIHKIRRALYYYTEETQRANCCPGGIISQTRKIFVEHHAARDHGRKDQRPEHWRKYH